MAERQALTRCSLQVRLEQAVAARAAAAKAAARVSLLACSALPLMITAVLAV